ncbi:hypothetical protein [Haloechinothrix sp. LS1_15]|uniref:hypothetical protein n=1 Tax=Haloechinothrix sp. LS1_15 TaxID=2652248 RepID=UPI00294524F0|nr:hypothetical protein [Haloechinothrix sp. LS1_15]MDV6012371.1 ferritin-like domain-containing protein [Haloechinothrix sp. LS1_15]
MSFDLADYARQAAPVPYEDLDYDAFGPDPLSEGALRCIRYMCDVETHTICYLRDLLVTPSHQDPEVTTFLTIWAYEEYWHGEALARVLDAHGIPTGNTHIQTLRQGLGFRDKLAPINQSIVANVLGEDFVAVHMTWGAINEWSTHAGYARLIEREQHPVLTELLTRIMRQETRHVAFYATQARQRLDRSRKARWLTRSALRAFWAPVGSGVMPSSETDYVLRFLLGGESGQQVVHRIDEKIHRLPGLDGMNLVSKAAREVGVPGALAA